MIQDTPLKGTNVDSQTRTHNNAQEHIRETLDHGPMNILAPNTVAMMLPEMTTPMDQEMCPQMCLWHMVKNHHHRARKRARVENHHHRARKRARAELLEETLPRTARNRYPRGRAKAEVLISNQEKNGRLMEKLEPVQRDYQIGRGSISKSV